MHILYIYILLSVDSTFSYQNVISLLCSKLQYARTYWLPMKSVIPSCHHLLLHAGLKLVENQKTGVNCGLHKT